VTAALRRRLFLVILANNDHGKTTLIRGFLNQAGRLEYAKPQKGKRMLTTPWAQEVDSYVFVRSFQETEKSTHPTPGEALLANDGGWTQRDLIVMPSHLDASDCAAMIDEAHKNGFDAIAIRVLFDRAEVSAGSACTALPWDARWTLDNVRVEDWTPQVLSLGGDLWGAVSAALFRP
jgi:hypothetical protein